MYDFPFVNPCQLLQITFLSFSLQKVFPGFFSITFLRTAVRLTSLQFPRSSFLSFLKITVTTAFLYNLISYMIFSILQFRGRKPDRKKHYENIFVYLYELLNFLICLRSQTLSHSISDYVYTTILTVPGSVQRHWKIHVLLLIFQDGYSTV